MPTTSGLRVDGIDLSHHNKVTMQGLSKARELGVRYVYLKSTEGATIKDPLYLTRRNMVRDVDLLVGAYHFARPDRDGRDGAKEAQFFLETAKPAAGDLLPVLDLEDANKLSKAQLTAWVGDFVSVVKKTLGVAPVIYTPFDLDNNFGCKLWVARYSDTNAAPRVPKPWVGWDMRQFSDGKLGKPNQIAGMHVDLNTLGADRGADLTALRIPVKPKPKPPRLHRTLKISTFNLLRGRDPQRVKGEVLRLINQEKVDVLMLQEASGYVDILRTIPGFDLVVFSSVPGQDESPILVRGSLKLAQRRPVQLTSDPDGKGPLMAGWITVTGGEVPAKWGTLIEVVQLEDEEGATFLSEHTPPTVQTAAQRLAAPRRWRAYQNMMASTGKVAKQAKGPFVIGADWNVNAETDKGTNSSFPRRVLAEAGMVRAFPKTPKRPIDYFGVKLGTVADVRALSGFGSDHPPVVGTLSYVV
jgi:GH25 family lysozyme M1 (1,4-beta-N-acetylmuramidase)